MNETVRIALDCFNGVELEEETAPGDGIDQTEVHEARLHMLERLTDESLGGRQGITLTGLRRSSLPPAFRSGDPYAKIYVMVEKSVDVPLAQQARMVGFSFCALRRPAGSKPHERYSGIYMPASYEAPRIFSIAVNEFADRLRLRYKPLAGKRKQQWITADRKPS